jgi:hypothetical protein
MTEAAGPKREKAKRLNPVARALAFHNEFRAQIIEGKRPRKRSRKKAVRDAAEE